MFLGEEADVFGYFRGVIIDSIAKSLGVEHGKEELLTGVVVGPPTQAKHGDMYTNAAMILGKKERKNPMDVAKTLCDIFGDIPGIESVNVVPPGFINFICTKTVWHSVIKKINQFKEDFGRVDIGGGEKVNVEFVSANPTGPLHVGHARGAVLGDVLSNLLEWVGYKVTREYYVNDAGSQIKTLVSSVYLRYLEVLGDDIVMEEGLYPGEYLKDVARSLVDKYGDTLRFMDNRDDVIRELTLNSMLESIREDLALMGVSHDVYVSERKLQDDNVVEECVEYLKERGVVCRGMLERPKWLEDDVEWEQREQLIFRSKDFGDDCNRALQKEDGSWTYFAGDIAYHFNKISRGFNRMVLVLGYDHKGYVARIKAIVKALSGGKAQIDVKLCNLVNFLENGAQVKMSKRKGDFLAVRDVVEEVGSDVTRFMLLTRKNDAVMNFDFAKACEESKDNQIFYIQYAHARVRSVVRSHTKLLPIEEVDFSFLSSDQEMSLAKLLAKWPSVVKYSAETHEPHGIAFYLIEVAEAFHMLWGCGVKNSDMRFIVEGDEQTTSARLYLAIATSLVISAGLAIFSIVPMEEMR
ncbi:arginine--tRNA ligase [Anaplasma platys]|nr:arginine--tRNA ligase [Anaplasma platys]